MKYTKDDNVFYQNNPATFVAYLSEDIAVIIVEAFPDFENTNVSGTCSACNVGDNDNKLSCTCEDTEYLLELLEDNTHPTKIPLVVSVKTLYDKPMVIFKHEKELEKMQALRVDLVEKTNKIRMENREVTNLKNELTREVESLQQRKEDYAQLEKAMTLKQFCERLGQSISHMLYADNDSRSIVGGNETKEFSFMGKKYSIDIQAYWKKSTHFSYVVTGVDFDFTDEESVIEF